MNTTTHRRHRHRTRLGLATVAAFSLVAAACGDDGDDGDGAAATTAPADDSMDETMEETVDEPAEDSMDETTEEAMDEPAEDSMDETMEEAMDETMEEMSGGPFGPACSAVPTDGEGSFDGMADDPAATAASNNPVLSTLVTAVGEAGLVDTLNGDGPFTIFAPTNDAFAAIDDDDLNAVLADTELLTSILTYHVVAGEQLSSADLVEAGTVTTVNGGDLMLGEEDGMLTVNDATSVCMDVTTANATVHIIDGVLMP